MSYGSLYISDISSTSEQYNGSDYESDSNVITISGTAENFAALKDTMDIHIAEDGATWKISSCEEDGETVYYLTLTGSKYNRTYRIYYSYEGEQES